MIDEQGRIVRSDEGTYTRSYQAGNLSFGTDEYVPAVRDWVEKGAESRFVMDRSELKQRLGKRTERQAQADAHFRLATFLQEGGNTESAQQHFQQAQRLAPESWNYHRQEWSYTPGQAGAKWFAKFQTLGETPYYAPMELPAGETKNKP